MKIVNLHDLSTQPVSHNPEIKKKVLFSKGELPHLTNFSQAVFAPNQIATSHRHLDMCEVFFVIAGEGVIRINNCDYALTPGVCVAVEAGEEHEIINTGTDELILTYFGIRSSS